MVESHFSSEMARNLKKTPEPSSQLTGMFIDGDLSPSASESTLDVINPSNGRRLFSAPLGSEGDVGRAVNSCRAAFDDGRWSDAAPSVKKAALRRLAELVLAEHRSLDVLDAAEMGKPVSERLYGAAAASDLVQFCAEAVDKVAGDTFASDRNSFVAQRRVPRGVVAAVVPWNFPTYNALSKVAPALAAGNSVILKPSELSSRSAMRLAELSISAGIPPGVFNVVTGAGEVVGRALGLHSDVDMLTFTGSTEVGRHMLRYASESNMKVVMAECGGKSPHIVFSDGVDLVAVSRFIARHLLTNQGQICSVGSRVLIESQLMAPFLKLIQEHLSEIVPGDALDEATTYGPLASAAQCARVMSYIQTAERDGARLITGGRRILPESGGYFVEPTVFTASASAKIAREEIFGPVLTVIPFETEAAAVRMANDTVYGLIAYVWTGDLSRGMRMAKQIRSSVLINAESPSGEGPGHAFSSEPQKQSGIGTEGGMAGVESYLQRQLIWINHK